MTWFPGGGHDWSVIHAKYIAINAAGLSCASQRPVALLSFADGLILPSQPPPPHQHRRPGKGEIAGYWRRQGDLSTKLPRLWAFRQNFSFFPTNLSSITPHGLCTGAPRAGAESANERAEGSAPPPPLHSHLHSLTRRNFPTTAHLRSNFSALVPSHIS